MLSDAFKYSKKSSHSVEMDFHSVVKLPYTHWQQFREVAKLSRIPWQQFRKVAKLLRIPWRQFHNFVIFSRISKAL